METNFYASFIQLKWYAHGLPPVIPAQLCAEKLQHLKREAQVLGAVKREYIAPTLYQEPWEQKTSVSESWDFQTVTTW